MAARIPQQWLINKSYKYAAALKKWKKKHKYFSIEAHYLYVYVCQCVHTYEYSEQLIYED